MLLIETPTEISFTIDKHEITGMVTGSPAEWDFTSQSKEFVKIVDSETLNKSEIHKGSFNLNELDLKISGELRKLLGN